MKLIAMKSVVVGSIAALAVGTTFGQWLPTSNEPATLKLQYSPLCNSKREQVRVRLEKSTSFLVMTDLKAGDVLYGVKFSMQINNRPRFEGVAYCKPHDGKELGFFSSYTAKQTNQRAAKFGFELCLYDFNNDGVFDEANYNAWYLQQAASKSYSDQFPYTVLEDGGETTPSCPRPILSAKALSIGQHLWDALTEVERTQLRGRGEIDIVPVKEAGTLLQVERIDDSTAGTNSGARLGEAVAGANYIDKSVNSGSYSATNQLGAQVVGAVVGGMLDSGPKTVLRTRYAVRSLDGEIVTRDKTEYTRDFTLPVGVCVSLPALERLDQRVCETTLSSLRAQYFPGTVASTVESASHTGSTKEARLRELKALFERGLVSENVFHEQQKRILSE